ncbi:MAG TPA: response regulator transcription factor [Chloroflexota bacterium]|nr:response regulator transcription factor [Chloroflexota bacterium]
MRILVVEDELLLGEQIVHGLREELHIVDLVRDGDVALDLLLPPQDDCYDIVVLDVRLPGRDGLSVCRAARAAGCRLPILLLTALGAIEDRVTGLDAGADDYLTKPFAFAELLARLRALGRREPQVRTGPLRVADLALDPITHRVSRGEDTIHLTARQYIILELLMRHAGQVLTRDQIAASAWDYSAEHASNVVDVFIGHLRRKIDDPYAVKLLATVRGVGYTLRDPSGAGRGSGP